MDASWLVCTSVFNSLSRHLWCFSIVGRVNALSMTMAAVTLSSVHDEYCPTDPARLRFLRLGADASDEHDEYRCAHVRRVRENHRNSVSDSSEAQAFSTRVQRCFHHELRAHVWQVFNTLDGHDSDASRIDQLLEPRPLDFQVSGAFQASSRRHGDRA